MKLELEITGVLLGTYAVKSKCKRRIFYKGFFMHLINMYLVLMYITQITGF
jgi:hypothetical protein